MHDLRDAIRAVRGAPLVSAAAVLSLALGIGGATTIFSILNGLLLKPLPVEAPHRLVVLTAAAPNQEAVSYPVWQAILEQQLFDRPFAWATDRVNVSGSGETAFVEAIWATAAFFEVLRVPPLLGRTIDRKDDVRGGGVNGPVAVISYAFWRRAFNGSNDAVGRTLTVERVPFTIVGVTPPSFLGLEVGTAFDVLMPLETEPLLGRTPARLDSPNWPWLRIMARLPDGQSADGLTTAVRRVQRLIRDTTMPPFRHADDRAGYLQAEWTVSAAPSGVSRFRRQYGPALLTLLAIVGVVLLIACTNIAMLMLARSAGRRYEFSVRLALGASRRRLAVQLLVESLILSITGASLGLAIAVWGSDILVRQLSTWAYRAVLDLSIDWRVLTVTAVAALTTAIVFGTAPALGAARAEPIDALKRRSRGGAGEGRLGIGGSLVVVQVALSLVLVMVAGLFLRSFVALAYRDLGFDRSRLLVAIVDSTRSTVEAEGRAALYERLREAIVGVGGVESAATSMATPLGSAGIRLTPTIEVPGGTNGRQQSRVLTNPISPQWFRTFGTRVVAGRDFEAADRGGAPQVVIVNQAFARRYFEGVTPIGRTIAEVGDTTDRVHWEIVGVVEDAAFTSVREAIEPTLYRPLAQATHEEMLRRFPRISISVRSASDRPDRLTGALAAAIERVDGNLSISFQTVAEQLNVFYIRERLLALLSAFFGLFALLLAALGLYGLMSYAVGRRGAEIGIRMALGASRATVMRMILARVSVLVVAGIAAGVVISFWVTTMVGALLYKIPPRDVVTFTIAAGALALVAATAGWFPARRAARIDPAIVLRES